MQVLILFIEITVIVLAFWAAWLTVPRRKIFVAKEVFEYAYAGWSGANEASVQPSVQPAPLFDWATLIERKELWIKRLARKSNHLIFFHLGEDLGLSAFIGKDSYEAVLSLEELAKKVEKPSQRLIFTAEQEHVQKLFAFLHENPGLRDVVAAVICLEPKLDEEWIEAHFTHEQMDLEQNHSIPYLVLASEPVLDMIEEPKHGWYSIDLQHLSILESERSQLKKPEFLRPALWNILDLLLFQ